MPWRTSSRWKAANGTALTSWSPRHRRSHAHRDIIDLTLIAAAARAGDDGLARALVTERAARKPAAEAAARHLITENGGSPDARRW